MRRPLRTDRARELFIDETAAVSATSADDALRLSHSIVLIDRVVSQSECVLLSKSAITRSHNVKLPTFSSTAGYGTRPGRIRCPVKRLLDKEKQVQCDAIFLRALAQIDACLPELCPRLFARGTLAAGVLHNSSLTFSPGEPAINIYTTGGDFQPHTDSQSITILIPLSRACGDDGGATAGGGDEDDDDLDDDDALLYAEGEYEGGGTAFWSREDSAPAADAPAADIKADEERSALLGARAAAAAPSAAATRGPPKMVLRPPPGTAIVFGGELTHAALPVLGVGGRRVVLVASFSPLVDARCAAECAHRRQRLWRTFVAALGRLWTRCKMC
jgi:hypothetical protein